MLPKLYFFWQIIYNFSVSEESTKWFVFNSGQGPCGAAVVQFVPFRCSGELCW
jgi:hypothetical protein